MKVLYIGHYREGSGWSEAAISYILALDAVGVDVVCRPIKLNQTKSELPSRILELESKDLSNITHVIQHILPHYTDINHSFKNIAMFIGETDSFGVSGWSNNLQLFDEIWVPNTDLLEPVKNLGPKLTVIPHATNIDKFKIEHEPFDIPALRDKFVFYFIGEYNRRKHVSAFLRAFHAEFDREDNVALVLKVNKPGYNIKELQELCKQNSDLCKEQLRKYKKPEYYNDELFFCDFLSEEDLARLHVTCDCFVNTSFGEAWSYPAFDAMGYGNLVISSNQGGPKDFLATPEFLVEGEYEPCFGADSPFSDLHTANENWFNISISDLQRKMRFALETSEEARNTNKKRALAYSYKAVGKKMKEALKNVE